MSVVIKIMNALGGSMTDGSTRLEGNIVVIEKMGDRSDALSEFEKRIASLERSYNDKICTRFGDRSEQMTKPNEERC
jgi:hypothetical protein